MSDHTRFWMNELAEDARHYLEKLEAFKNAPEGDEKDDLDGEVYAAIVQIKVHATHLQEALDEEVDAMPDDELEDEAASPVSSA